MNRVVYSKKFKTFGVIIGIFIFYLTIRIKDYEHKAFVFLPKLHPNIIWEFVADFSNMKLLNPTIVGFKILDESGNYEHWKYSVEYSEHLSHWPYLSNNAIAHFNVKTLSKNRVYLIDSVHTTCLFSGLFCLEAQSEFKFSQTNNTSLDGALCEENVLYQCPAFLSLFCKREVIFQRTAIMNNLKKYFLKL